MIIFYHIVLQCIAYPKGIYILCSVYTAYIMIYYIINEYNNITSVLRIIRYVNLHNKVLISRPKLSENSPRLYLYSFSTLKTKQNKKKRMVNSK